MTNSTKMREPEWLVFLRTVLLGAVLAEIFQIGKLSGATWGQHLAIDGRVWPVILGAPLLFLYLCLRITRLDAWRVISSGRIDLAVLFLAGAQFDHLLTPQLATFHDAVSKLDAGWSQAMLVVLLMMLMSPVIRHWWPFIRPYAKQLMILMARAIQQFALSRKLVQIGQSIWRDTKLFMERKRLEIQELLRSRKLAKPQSQLHFISDAEISDPAHDVLEVKKQATDFAKTVLSSASQEGMVFGIDGPWGVGKTSFLNIATKHWEQGARDSGVIVFKFEPLRYASEPDLAERFIRDLCAKIHQEVFAPEFLPVATRYSRMLKGKTDISIFGIKLTLEPSNETIDELLGDIDHLLEQIDRQLIVIIDDLDRLEPKLVNNVLFTVRRTFKLSRATYILCFDTEMLVAGKDEGSRAREFLEKFITAKLSLFVDLQVIKAFLETDWHADADRSQMISPDAMFKLRQILSEASQLLSGPQAHHYIPLLGDLRKVKRFVNAMLMMNLEKHDLSQSDFHNTDLIHLVLLHLFYPGLFRRIYSEETEGRKGSFSLCRGKDSGASGLENAAGFQEIVATYEQEPSAQFLLKQLFDETTINFPQFFDTDQEVWRTRACFNFDSRNLENYLQLIVRFKVPEETSTFRMYKNLLEEVMDERTPVTEVLKRHQFTAPTCEDVHDKFWRIIVNNAHQLNRAVAMDAIATLVNWLPRYSMLGQGDRSLRQRSIYSLVLLLDRAGFGKPLNDRVRLPTDVVEIANRILGTGQFQPSPSLIQQLAAPMRGPLGWKDLMLFRLTCCADRLGQVHNIYSALIRHEEPNSRSEGDVNSIALNSMRRFTQQVFQEFKKQYIDPKINFFTAVDGITDAAIHGELRPSATSDTETGNELKAARSAIKSFVIYQLANQRRGSNGIGCGVYDETGKEDSGGIHRAMGDYLLGFCFNPAFGLPHARAFADHGLRVFQTEMFDTMDSRYDLPATQRALTNLLDRERMEAFWVKSGEEIKKMLINESGTVICYQFQATYADRLPGVFEALDALLVAEQPAPHDSQPPESTEHYATKA